MLSAAPFYLPKTPPASGRRAMLSPVAIAASRVDETMRPPAGTPPAQQTSR